MRDEPHADPFRADQADHLFDFIQQHLRSIVEQQVRFIEEEHQFWFLQIARFRQLFIQLGEHPQQAGGVQFGHLVELLGAEDINHPFAAGVGTHPVFDVQHRFAKEVCRSLLLQRQQSALDSPDRGAADIAVLILEGFSVIANVLGDGPQVFEIEQQQTLVIGNTEDNIQHAGLHVVEVQQTGQQQRTEV